MMRVVREPRPPTGTDISQETCGIVKSTLQDLIHNTLHLEGTYRMTYCFSNAFSAGWDTLKSNYGVVLGATVVYMIIAMVVGVIPIIGALLSLFIVTPVLAGLLVLGVKAHQGSPQFSDLFVGFSKYLPVLGIGLLLGLVYFVIAIPIFVVMAVGSIPPFGDPDAFSQNPPSAGLIAAMAIAYLFAIVCNVFITSRVMFAYPLCLQADLGVVDSIKTSWTSTKPVMWTQIGLLIVMGLIVAVCAVACFVPAVFFGLPLMICVYGAAYNLLMNHQASQDAAARTF